MTALNYVNLLLL